MRTQQFTAKAKKMITWVQNGVKKRLPLFPKLDTLDQSRLRFKNPIPPKPAPMKFAVAFLGATQQRKAKDPSMGKANSGRNCQNVTAPRTAQKVCICFLEVVDGKSLCFFCVSNNAVWQRAWNLSLCQSKWILIYTRIFTMDIGDHIEETAERWQRRSIR